MDVTKTTPTIPSNADNVKLGEGSFGKVYATKAGKINSATKHVRLNFGLNELPFIHDTTLREYAALAQSGGGYVPKLTKAAKFDVVKDNLELTMTNGGMSLLAYAKTISYIERLNFVPSLIYQLSQALLQLQRSGILHGDVKPDNILVDPKTKRVRVIDFGITSFIQGELSNGVYIDQGTYLYSSYETLNESIAYKTSCVWSIVMSVWDFLYKHYGGAENFITGKKPAVSFSYSKKDLPVNKRVGEIFKFLNEQIVVSGKSQIDLTDYVVFEDVKKVFPSIHSLIGKMVDMEASTRITLEEICSSPELLSVYKPSYVRLPKLRNTTIVSDGWKSNQDQRETQINALIVTASMMNYTKYLPLATLLLDLYLSKISIAKEKLYLAGLSCLSIAIALSDNCENLSDDLHTSLFKPYSLKDLFKMNLHIVQTLKGRIYYRTFVLDIIEKYGVVNYNVANRIILASSAPYDNQVLLQRYEESCYAKY